MPVGAGPFPAVVLVHGSGPNDRDETVEGNRPFRDLAWGLASRGVAVLRYEKRTRQHGTKLAAVKDFTVRQETVDDALAAADLLRHTGGIDPRRVFVLGHSLGGMLIPRIGQRDPQLAGLIVMAGAAKPLEDIILEQVAYLDAADGAVTDSEKSRLESLRAEVARVKALKPDATGTALGAPVSYWLDLQGYNPPAAAKALKAPLLDPPGGARLPGDDGQLRGLEAGPRGQPRPSTPIPSSTISSSRGRGRARRRSTRRRATCPRRWSPTSRSGSAGSRSRAATGKPS